MPLDTSDFPKSLRDTLHVGNRRVHEAIDLARGDPDIGDDPVLALAYVEEARRLRDILGVGFATIDKASELARTNPEIGSDIVLAIACVEAHALAIDVKGGAEARRAWNLRQGRSIADGWRMAYPGLAKFAIL